MKKIKFYLGLLLALILLCSAPSAAALAADTTNAANVPSVDQPEEEVIIEYNDVQILTVRPAMQSAERATKSAQICQTLSEALNYVRGEMIARKESISVIVPENVYSELDLEYYEDLTEHTGDPRGGDYLRSSITYIWASYSTTEEGIYEVDYFFGYKTDADEEAEADSEVDRLLSALDLSNGSNSDYDKIKAIHDYLVENVNYDYGTAYGETTDYPETYTGYGALVKHFAVCQGFAAAFYRLCLEAGIDARLIDSNEMGHAWNIVQIDDLYYLIDCTWDENTNSDDYFLRGKYDFLEHANSDDQFHDSEFAAKHPLSDYKYGITIHSLGTAPDYTLITEDRRTVSTAAQNGRAKVLIFFLEGSERFLNTMETLRGKEYDGVDFVYVNMSHYLTEDQQVILAQIGNEMPADVPGTYAVCSNGKDACAEFAEISGIDDGSGQVDSACVFLISPDNEILFAIHTYSGEIGALVESILEDADLPEAPEPGEDPYAGFTAIGLCGKNAVWRFYGSDGGAYGKGSLLIDGKGELWDNISYYTPIGWLSDWQSEDYSLSGENIQAADVKKLIIGDGITYIGTNELSGFTSLQSITFKGSAPSIESDHGLTRNIRIYFPEDDASWNEVDKSLFSDSCKWISQDANGVHHHKWGAWTVTKPATMAEEGIKERACTECGEKETEAILKIEGTLPGKTTRGDMFNLGHNVKVTWKEVPGAAWYKVYREGITDPKETQTDPVIVTTGLVGWDKEPGLTNGHAYRYRIVASLTGKGDPSGDSPLSYSKVMYRLTTVVIRSAKNLAPGKVTVKFDKTTCGDSYVLQWSEYKDMRNPKIKTIVGANNTSYVIGGLKKGKTYYISIRVRKKVDGIDYYTTFGVAKDVLIKQ